MTSIVYKLIKLISETYSIKESDLLKLLNEVQKSSMIENIHERRCPCRIQRGAKAGEVCNAKIRNPGEEYCSKHRTRKIKDDIQPSVTMITNESELDTGETGEAKDEIDLFLIRFDEKTVKWYVPSLSLDGGNVIFYIHSRGDKRIASCLKNGVLCELDRDDEKYCINHGFKIYRQSSE